MRVLKFLVEGQIIRPDPSCDFSGLVPGTQGYLQAEFEFSKEWKGCLKVAEFHCLGNECPPQVLEDGKNCIIPAEALVGRNFSIKIWGKRNGFKITTDTVRVSQNGGSR